MCCVAKQGHFHFYKNKHNNLESKTKGQLNLTSSELSNRLTMSGRTWPSDGGL